MKNWTIKKRVISGFAGIVAITTLLGCIALLCLARIDVSIGKVTQQSLPGLHMSGQIEAAIAHNGCLVLKYILAEDGATKAKIKAKIDAQRDSNTQLIADYEKTVVTEEDRKVLAKMKGAREAYGKVRTEVLRLSADGKTKDATGMAFRDMDPAYETYMAAVKEVSAYNKKAADRDASDILASSAEAATGVKLGLAAAILVSLVLGFTILRGINRALRRLSLSLSDGSQQVAAAAGQVSSASQTLAEGASQQAASLEETSASLEEMSSMTNRNSETAQRVKALAKQARQAGENGEADMASMKEAMDGIKQSNGDVAKIIKTIDEIAFQTNILALNAAVEAARAGEAGMGFAVVAEEVRSLAQRCAQAARETASKIEDAVQRGTHGVEISAKVARGLGEIVARAREVDELAGEVAGASQEQTQGIGQVSRAVVEMDHVIQSTASSAEESASAAEEMNAQADSLRDAVAELVRLVDGGTKTTQRSASGFRSPAPQSQHASRASQLDRRPGPKASLAQGKVAAGKPSLSNGNGLHKEGCGEDGAEGASFFEDTHTA